MVDSAGSGIVEPSQVVLEDGIGRGCLGSSRLRLSLARWRMKDRCVRAFRRRRSRIKEAGVGNAGKDRIGDYGLID